MPYEFLPNILNREYSTPKLKEAWYTQVSENGLEANIIIATLS